MAQKYLLYLLTQVKKIFVATELLFPMKNTLPAETFMNKPI